MKKRLIPNLFYIKKNERENRLKIFVIAKYVIKFI
jgi:hypothetical protein